VEADAELPGHGLEAVGPKPVILPGKPQGVQGRIARVADARPAKLGGQKVKVKGGVVGDDGSPGQEAEQLGQEVGEPGGARNHPVGEAVYSRGSWRDRAARIDQT
jgi:hypothetical protein